ncbi:ABC transporter family substrate-binding protein [Galbitalea sp. SE-J8]|uniref:ABC transporter family substrate-binding protein n=1 Tax=Galbitalea sp. SE-J8 TaxID=3054952 RepID=UPI00259CB16B|nr:ABC transporter family substrate-binding protein [Galbitalea sp. SE-J8]MDM4763354.1 ABC transporter family substrate-binding protein [Galbitalea sp. SE-J8]
MRIGLNRRSRLGVGLAAIGITALALAGCTDTTSTPGASDSPAATSDSNATVTVAVVNEATSFNFNTPDGNLDTNGFINYLTQPQFFTLDQNFEVVPNTDLGTVEKLSDDPLTVKYTLNKDAKWSDGEAMTADDLLLGWAIGSCYYNEDYFPTAGGCTGIDLSMPEVGDDNTSITFSYSKPYVDWNLVNPIQFPAHVVADEVGSTVEDIDSAITDTKRGGSNDLLKKVSDFVTTGYDATALPSDPKLLVSGGPMIVTDWTPKQSMTFERNPDYTGDHAVKFSKLVMRFIGDANAQVTALQNGEVDAIAPQASADTIKALQSAKANIIQFSQVSYDHLDLTMDSKVFSDPDVRKAFLLTIPRQKILDDIVTPVQSDAKVLDSQVFVPGQEGYDESVAANGSSAFDEVDIDQAKQLLAGKTPTVKLMYNTANPNRVDEFQAIQASAEQAGFTIEDAGTPDWSKKLGDGSYDAVLFGWINPGAGNAAFPQVFKTGGGGNYNNYSDKAVDALVDQTQTELDASKLLTLKEQIDAATFADGYGLPLFQSPGVFATLGKLKGVEQFGGQNSLFWNIWDWTK